MLADISVYLPRGDACRCWSGCELSLIDGGKRAVLVAPRYEGYFGVIPGEIVQVLTRSPAVRRGVASAAARLEALVSRSCAPSV